MPPEPPDQIVITDLNHHVRTLLQRELERENLKATCIVSGSRVIELINDPGPIQVMVLDPELIRPYGYRNLERLIRVKAPPRIILHAHSQLGGALARGENPVIVQKSSSSYLAVKELIISYLADRAATSKS